MNPRSETADNQDYDLVQVLRALRRFWWIVIAVPALILVILSYRNLTAPYQSEFRASVLIPGDTEIPGSAERPELMILDDLGSVVASRAFAELVATESGIPLSDVEGSLGASRYSRVATVSVTGDDENLVRRVAGAAANQFPSAVNAFMVPIGGNQATVVILDPPSEPRRGDGDKWTIAAIATAVGFMIGCFAALAFDACLGGTRRSSS